MTALRKARRLSVAEFIEMIRPLQDEQHWELLDGEAVLMSPQSERHQTIVMNLLRWADCWARAKGCRALPGLGVLNDAIDDYAPIPDVLVRCGPMVQGGDPVFIAEVLSPSTMSNDRGRKLEFYKSIPGLGSLMIVYQDETRVEHWMRDGDAWRHEVAQGRAATVAIAGLDASLALADLYDGVPLA
jgi:Uma2 family endonuclease